MIVFYFSESGQCLISLDCGMSEITISDNKAYYGGKVVINGMDRVSYAEVPAQKIYTETVDDEGFPIRIQKPYSELEHGDVPPSAADRIAALEDALLELLGGA